MTVRAIDKLSQRIDQVDSLVCVGLDADISQLPTRFLGLDQPQFEFNKWIIDQTHEHVCAYKPNLAFYEARGVAGWQDLESTMQYLRANHPDIFTIADAKRADIGNTNAGYVQAMYDQLGFDAITLHPYLGKEALSPFLERADKVAIILCRTSNPGAGELQDLFTSPQPSPKIGEGASPMWQVVAQRVSQNWNQHSNCMLVVGATYPQELGKVRQIVGDMPILVPGIGAQGGDLEATLESGLDSRGRGLVISSSRGIIFADNPANETSSLKDKIRDQISNRSRH